SLRVRLLVAVLSLRVAAAAVMGAVTYRNVLAETEAIFDYQLRQMALSLRDQGEIAPDQARAFADEQLDFVIQIWTVDGRSIYASRAHTALPARALLGFANVRVGDETWRTFSVAPPVRVIQVAQPLQIRERLAAHAALRSVTPLLLVAPLMALVVWWGAALTLRPRGGRAGGGGRGEWRSCCGGGPPSRCARCVPWPRTCAAATSSRSRRCPPPACRRRCRRW